MLLLIIGLLIWSSLHFVPAIAIAQRTQLMSTYGEIKYKIIYSILVFVSIALMVFGWRSIEPTFIYMPFESSPVITVLIMFITVILFFVARLKSNLKRIIRHPQLTAVILWSVAHLLSNGDSRSLILFGTLGIWAIAEIILINRREGGWIKPEPIPIKSELKVAAIGIGMFTVFLFAHPYLSGVSLTAQ